MMPPEAAQPRGRDIALIWLIAALVAIPTLLWALSAMRALDVPPSAAFFEYNAQRVEEFHQETAAGALGVVLIGDSRVRYGTELQDVLSERITDELGEEVAVLRLTNDWATYQDFDPLMPLILEAEPALVLLQEELRLKNRGYDASEAIKREYLWWRLLGDGLWNPGGNEQVFYQEEMTCEVLGVEALEDRVVRLGRWVDFDADGPAVAQVKALVQELEESNVVLRYLDVPISADAQAALPGVELSPAPLGITPDVSVGDANYCDFVHMNETARATYTDWFVVAIADELKPILESQ